VPLKVALEDPLGRDVSFAKRVAEPDEVAAVNHYVPRRKEDLRAERLRLIHPRQMDDC